MKNIKNINRAELKAILTDTKAINGCTFIGFDMVTKVALTGGKKNPMQGEVDKIHTGFVAMLFSNKLRSAYGTMVNKRLTQSGKDADFVPSALPWGTRVEGTPVIEHKGDNYVQLIYTQKTVNLRQFVKSNGISLSDNDTELLALMESTVVGYNTPNGNISYTRNGQPIAKEDIEGMKASTSNGKQGGLSDEMKVIVRSPKLEGVARMTMNGTVYNIVD